MLLYFVFNTWGVLATSPYTYQRSAQPHLCGDSNFLSCLLVNMRKYNTCTYNDVFLRLWEFFQVNKSGEEF